MITIFLKISYYEKISDILYIVEGLNSTLDTLSTCLNDVQIFNLGLWSLITIVSNCECQIYKNCWFSCAMFLNLFLKSSFVEECFKVFQLFFGLVDYAHNRFSDKRFQRLIRYKIRCLKIFCSTILFFIW